MSEVLISLRGISKRFFAKEGETVALDNVSLDIYKGDIFGIIGQSGAGKSTLVRIMNLLERPLEGSVVVDGQDLIANPTALNATRMNMGMIFQGFNLLMQRTVLRNITFSMEIAKIGNRESRKSRALELLEIVGLTEKAYSYPSSLSGGQKQRVAIARALATSPKVLLCDEATSALDPQTTQSILELLKQINRTLGITIVIITHEMSVVQSICNRVAILEQGKIAEISSTVDLFSNPQSASAKRLLFSEDNKQRIFNKNCFRIVFNGTETDRPLIADMVLEAGTPVNILMANTKDIDGLTFGQMIIEVAEGVDIVPFLQKRQLSFKRLGE